MVQKTYMYHKVIDSQITIHAYQKLLHMYIIKIHAHTIKAGLTWLALTVSDPLLTLAQI